MKLNALSLLQLALTSPATLNTECRDGMIESIAPGYVVQYRCDIYQPGTLHRGIATIQECALLAKDTPPYISSYEPRSKMCLTAREGAPWKTRPGIYSTIKLPPPGTPDPGDGGDGGDGDDELKSELKACQASNAVQCNRDDEQMVPINGTNYRVYCSRTWPFYDHKDSFDKIPTPSECGDKCNEDDSCSFVHYQPKDGSCITYTETHNDEKPTQANDGTWYSLLKEGK